MDLDTLSVKKRLLARLMRCEDAEVLYAIELLLERTESADGAPSAMELEAILGAVGRALRGGAGPTS